jgi:hypothetical protein
MSWHKLTPEQRMQLLFVALFLVGVACTVFMVFTRLK